MMRVAIGRPWRRQVEAGTEHSAGRHVEEATGRGRTRAAGFWGDLGVRDLANTVRRICTLCGWTQAPEGRGNVLAITSALPKEGKTSLAAGMAIISARDHEAQVLLVECDLLHPSLDADFELGGGPGLSEVLDGTATLDEALRRTEFSNLWLLPAGETPENPSRLLRSAAMEALLQEARDRFGFIVADLPPVLATSDAPVLSKLADGTVVVVRAGVTDRRKVQEALDLLRGTTLHGVVLNRWRSRVPDVVRRFFEK